jgi:hypothetical protein
MLMGRKAGKGVGGTTPLLHRHQPAPSGETTAAGLTRRGRPGIWGKTTGLGPIAVTHQARVSAVAVATALTDV